MNLRIDEDAEVVRLHVSGRITQQGLPHLVEPVAELVGESAYQRPLLLNLREADFLDSSGIGWLVRCHKRCREQGGRFVLHSLQPPVRQVLGLLNLLSVLEVAESEDEGFRRLRGETL